MSLPDFSSQMDLFGLQRQLVFEESDRYRLFFEKIYPILAKARERLAACYCLENGRPGVEPVVLLGMSLLQFMERMPDRQAVEQFRYHVGWKYALNQELNSDVFDASVLVRFRDRLLEHEEGRLVFEVVREALEEAGLMAKRGRQRMDSTYVLGLVKRMSALDCVRESLRCGLEELSHSVEKRPDFWNLLWERYVESRLDYRASEGTLREKMGQAGKDIWALLNWLDKRKGLIGEGPKCLILRRVFQEQFRVEEKEVVAERTGSGQIQNPHDPEAQYRTKQQGKRGWVGYMVQVAETVSEKPVAPGEPTENFITSIVTQTALGSDEAGMAETMEEQGQMGMEKPGELYVDGAYISGKELAIAAEENRELIGPAVAAHAGKKAEFRVSDFTVDVHGREALCPAGQTSTQCSRIEDRWNGIVEYRFEWSWRCQACPERTKCLSAGQTHRTIRVGPHHMHLQARRREMNTDTFREKMKRRAAIEGTQSELVRGHGARRARYRGLSKVRLQNYFIGAACNVKRWLRRIAWDRQHLAWPLPGVQAA